jgi:hypothetical protein
VSVIRLFISSVQKEVPAERRALWHCLCGDALWEHFFDLFLVEDPVSLRFLKRLKVYEVIGWMGSQLGGHREVMK